MYGPVKINWMEANPGVEYSFRQVVVWRTCNVKHGGDEPMKHCVCGYHCKSHHDPQFSNGRMDGSQTLLTSIRQPTDLHTRGTVLWKRWWSSIRNTSVLAHTWLT